MTLQRVLFLFVFLACLTAAGIPAAAAQGETGVTMTIRAGFDRYCKEGRWIPLRVRLENRGPDLEAQVEVHLRGSLGNEITYLAPVSLPATSRKEITLEVFPDSYLAEIPVSLVSGTQKIAEETVRLNCLGRNDRLIGVLAGSASPFAILADLDPPTGSATVAELEPGDLAGKARLLEALDILVISDTDTGAFTTAQRDALSAWISAGGRLWVSGGPSWQKTSAGLAGLLPLAPNGDQTTEVRGLGEFLISPEFGEPEGPAIVATGSLLEGSEALARASETGLPLILRKQLGSGEIVYLAADPALAPLRNWDGMMEVYRRLLAWQAARPAWAQGFQDWYLAAQAAATFPSLELPSGLLICGFLGLYVAAIGPLNYFILRRMKRRELAWVSIPILVITFSGLAFAFGSRLRGSLPVLNRLAIVQAEAGSSQARVDGLVGVYSPTRRSYQVRFGSGLLAHPLPNAGGARPWQIQDRDGQVAVTGLRLDIGEIVPLALQGSLPAPAMTHDLALVVQPSADPEAILQGSLTNHSDLSFENVVLLAPGASRNYGVLAPGQTIQVNLPLPRAAGVGFAQGSLMRPVVPYPMVSPGIYSRPDLTIEEILGTSRYYDDKDSYRRYAMLASALNANAMGFNRGGGFALSGWVQDSPLEVSLWAGRDSPVAFDTLDTTLYLVSLRPSLSLGKDPFILPPGLFTWSLLDSSLPAEASPYETLLSSGSFTLQFDLALPVPYRAVRSLSLNLEGPSTGGSTGLEISLWNYMESAWTPYPEAAWGKNDLPAPERFVGPGGQIRLRIADGDPTRDTRIDAADFTLSVSP